jgi:hypothetical protein
LPRFTATSTYGTATEARMPTIATVITSSISVNPERREE